ncbi:MAG: hypothetical protein QF886_19025, partial [Planctomycetota bacterium]|nr:hypothetical protein [Planctomycetota bacterium]
LGDVDSFFEWLASEQRTAGQISEALAVCAKLDGSADEKADFFYRLLEWTGTAETQELSDKLKSIFDHCLRQDRTRRVIRERLESAPAHQVSALLDNASNCSLNHFREIAQDFLLHEIDHLQEHDLERGMEALARLQTDESRMKLMSLYLSEMGIGKIVSNSVRSLLRPEHHGSQK